ncbi:MAG: FMN-dependent NADH-azoreductase [Frankiales bacterium]|jgi:FMN-dependent NADH-azoreductase|nr:FMN-dependent NADH-azoreductase [Frankiales bacterium]
MTLFRLDASIRTEGSVSREIADLVEQSWRDGHPDERIVRRHVGTEPIPATYWAAATSARFTPAEKLTDEQQAATALAATLVDELAGADALLFAVPLYNFGVSQHFKAYVDLVVTDPRMGPGEPLLKGKPAELVTVRGGSYGPGTPRDGWDHSTGWIRRILQDVWQVDLAVVETEFTLAGVNPALDEFKELGAKLRAESEALARLHGAVLSA